MKLSRERLLGCLPQTPPNVERVVERTLAQLHRQAPLPAPKPYVRRLSFGMAVLLCLLMAALGIAAGIRYGVFDFMARVTQTSGVLPQASELVQNDLATLETEHATITLSQAVYDGGSLRMVYSVTQKDASEPVTEQSLLDENSAFRRAMAADGISLWGCDWLYLNGVEMTMPGGTSVDTIPGTQNGEALCYLNIPLAAAGITPQDDLDVRLPIIRHGRDDIRTLDFTVKTADTEISNPPTLRANGARITVLSAWLSPVRATVTLRVECEESTSAQAFDVALGNWRNAVLINAQCDALSPLEELVALDGKDGEYAVLAFTYLPTNAAEVYIAPTIIDQNNRWLVDMSQALKLQ